MLPASGPNDAPSSRRSPEPRRHPGQLGKASLSSRPVSGRATVPATRARSLRPDGRKEPPRGSHRRWSSKSWLDAQHLAMVWLVEARRPMRGGAREWRLTVQGHDALLSGLGISPPAKCDGPDSRDIESPKGL